LQLIAVQLNYDISKRFYLTGQASFAYEGESGGYADGMFGFGVYAPKILNKKVQFFAEGLLGASGGAGVDTGEGIAIKPKIGASFFFNDSFAILLSGGKIISPFGEVNSTNLNIGFSFNFSTVSYKTTKR